ncbi:MAG TPA: DUF1990 family protein [Polyangiaceae bacterium]|jgi:hypothetical protein|nr:DUF1990 family protein [Polyangiaceae bacterium]
MSSEFFSDRRPLLPARLGAGQYLQRDYWAVIRECRPRPSELMRAVRERFTEFAPAELASFRRVEAATGPLEVDDELEVRIAAAGTCFVRVVHTDEQSLTLGTLQGHPEAGRITFGAYCNARDDVIFHIRSRARSGSRVMYAGFLAAGEAMQTNTWTDFISAVAHSFGSGVIGFIHSETQRIPNGPQAAAEECSPTFLARGDHAGQG